MDDSGNSKRRRGLGVITPNACTECRKKRAKCDGNNPCGRCVMQDGECLYEIPVRQSKETMRTEIEQLRAQQNQSERVLAALVLSELSDEVLDQLRSGETLEFVSDKLGKGRNMTESRAFNATTYSKQSDHHAITSALKPSRSLASSPPSTLAYSDPFEYSPSQQDPNLWTGWTGEKGGSSQGQSSSNHEDITSWTPGAPISRHSSAPLVGRWHQQPDGDSSPDTVTQSMREEGRETLLGQRFNKNDSLEYNNIESWTEVTSDEALIVHLMALYFCWEYPTFASLSKEHFLDDFRMGIQRHCSALLVNAMLAVGCRFSTQAATRTVSNDSNTSGDHFFAEASRLLLIEEDHHVTTTVQALGLMSIREASCGRSSEALYYSGQSIRLAIEMGLHLDSESGGGDNASLEHAVRSATFWGAFALDQCWSLCIGKLPHFSRDMVIVAKPSIVDNVEATPWIPYTDDGAPLERNCTQPSNVRSVYQTYCELSEITHKTHYILFIPGTNLTAKALLDMYTQYLRWYDEIPEAVRLGHNFTPSVLFAHLYYQFAILLLFRPFIKLELVDSGVSPRDVCAQAADAILALVKCYAQLYTLRRTPSFVPYFVLAAGITHLVIFGTGHGGPSKIHQGIADLKTMASCHGFSTQAREILQFLADQWQVDVALDRSDGRDPRFTCRPQPASLNLFCPNFESVDINCNINALEGKGESPLFLPFLMQGRPLMAVGNELELAGFRSLSGSL